MFQFHAHIYFLVGHFALSVGPYMQYCAVARQRVNSKFTAVHLMVLSFRSADGGELTRGVASSLSSTFFACV